MKAKKGKGGFRVPENYFRELPGQIEQRMQAPEGIRMPEDDGFRVPDDYFEGLQGRLEERLAESTVNVRPLWPKRLGWAAAAAAAIALLVTFWPAASVESLQFDDLAGAEIQQYLEDGEDDMDTYELAESLPLENIVLGDMLESLPEEDQILDYLSRDNESVDELYWDNNE